MKRASFTWGRPIQSLNWWNHTRSVGARQEKWRHAREERHKASILTMSLVRRNKMRPPYLITITRLMGPGRRAFDEHNMEGGCKHIEDGIADGLGMHDNDPRIRWAPYRQERAEKDGARVEIKEA